MKKKYFGIGFLAGLMIGMIMIFIFPNYLNIGRFFLAKNAVDFYQAKSSIYTTSLLPLFVFGIVGGMTGILFAKIIQVFKHT